MHEGQGEVYDDGKHPTPRQFPNPQFPEPRKLAKLRLPQGDLPTPAGFLGFSPWINLACDSPTSGNPGEGLLPLESFGGVRI